MSGGDLLNIDLHVGTDWTTTLSQVFTILRKYDFATQDTFSFGSFEPKFDFHGMTTSAFFLIGARYIKISKLFFFSVDFELTTAAPLASEISFELGNVVFPYGANGRIRAQTGGFQVNAETGFWNALSGENKINLFRPGVVNYTAAGQRLAVNGFVEIL